MRHTLPALSPAVRKTKSVPSRQTVLFSTPSPRHIPRLGVFYKKVMIPIPSHFSPTIFRKIAVLNNQPIGSWKSQGFCSPSQELIFCIRSILLLGSPVYTFHTRASQLSTMLRFAGMRLDNPASVADHTLLVTYICMVVADEWNRNHPESPVNTEEVLKKALLHDLEEGLIGDIPSPIKNRLPEFKKAYKKLGEKLVAEEIFKTCPGGSEYVRLWRDAKVDQTGEILKIADMLDALATAHAEIKRGNHQLEPAYREFVSWCNDHRKTLEKYPAALNFFTAIAET